jgi:hypothetical protein
MPEDYQKVVLDDYAKKVINGSIAPSLLDPTPGSFRERCIYVYKERCSTDDDEIIKSFLGSAGKECLSLLENSLAVKFRQLPKILKGKVENPNIKYIELIAWLIDFKPRPSTAYYKSFYSQPQQNEEEVISKGEDKDVSLEMSEIETKIPTSQPKNISIGEVPTGDQEGTIKMPQPIVSDSNNELSPPARLSYLERLILWLEAGPHAGKKKLVVALIPVTLIALASYTFFEHTGSQCMYWTGNEYQSVGCSLKIDHAQVIALDRHKLNNLKKINRLDTITEKDLGKVWYVKIKVDSAEFYTDSGEYPLDIRKRLLPVTPYILNKYILKKGSAD